MSWSGTYSHTLLLALDEWGAMVFFNRKTGGITISTMAGLVRDGKDAPFELYTWQRSFLRWLEPKLSREHCIEALAADRARLTLALSLIGV